MTSATDLQPFLEVPFLVEALLNGPRLSVSELMALRTGSVIPIGVPAGENVNVTAGASLIGAGELTVVEGRRVVRMVKLGAKE